jgi:hypothetical protein
VLGPFSLQQPFSDFWQSAEPVNRTFLLGNLAETRQLFRGVREGDTPSERWQTLAHGKIAALDNLSRKIDAAKELLRSPLRVQRSRRVRPADLRDEAGVTIFCAAEAAHRNAVLDLVYLCCARQSSLGAEPADRLCLARFGIHSRSAERPPPDRLASVQQPDFGCQQPPGTLDRNLATTYSSTASTDRFCLSPWKV